MIHRVPPSLLSSPSHPAWASSTVLVLCCLILSGCSASLRNVRAHLERGDHVEAAVTAGDDHHGLQQVALAILADAFKDSETRPRAKAGLRASGDLAHPILRELADDDDATTALIAASILAAQGDGDARARLRQARDHEDPEVRAAAVNLIENSSTSADDLRLALDDPASAVRLAAIGVIASHHRDAPFATPLLAERARRDPDTSVRSAALRVLSYCNDDQILLDAIRLAIADAQPEPLRLVAVSTLERARDQDAAMTLLHERLANGSEPEKVRAAAVLARLGDQDGITFLHQALRSRSVTIAAGAAIAASTLGEPLATALLEALERSEPEVRLHAALALVRGPNEDRAIEALSQLSTRDDRFGAWATIELAHHQRSTRGLRARLEAFLAHDARELRLLVARRCGRLDVGFELAARALRDDDSSVRLAAAASLLRARRRELGPS